MYGVINKARDGPKPKERKKKIMNEKSYIVEITKKIATRSGIIESVESVYLSATSKRAANEKARYLYPRGKATYKAIED